MWPVGSVKVFYIYIYIYNVYFMSTPLPSPVLSHLDDWLTINSDNVITIHSSDVLQAPGVQVILSRSRFGYLVIIRFMVLSFWGNLPTMAEMRAVQVNESKCCVTESKNTVRKAPLISTDLRRTVELNDYSLWVSQDTTPTVFLIHCFHDPLLV